MHGRAKTIDNVIVTKIGFKHEMVKHLNKYYDKLKEPHAGQYPPNKIMPDWAVIKYSKGKLEVFHRHIGLCDIPTLKLRIAAVKNDK